jgi:hypothetical protein
MRTSFAELMIANWLPTLEHFYQRTEADDTRYPEALAHSYSFFRWVRSPSIA